MIINKKDKKFILLSTIVCLLPIGMYLAVYDKLPAQMGMQWDFEGNVNWYAPKAMAVFLSPSILALLHLVSVFTRRNDPKKEHTSLAIQVIMDWLIPILSIPVSVYSILQNTGTSVRRTIPLVAIGLILILAGNYMPKIRQNYTIGIRIPWTLNNSHNWNKTHRMAGYLWIVGGIIFIMGSFVIRESTVLFAVSLAVLAVMILVPFIYSYLLYKN